MKKRADGRNNLLAVVIVEKHRSTHGNPLSKEEEKLLLEKMAGTKRKVSRFCLRDREKRQKIKEGGNPMVIYIPETRNAFVLSHIATQKGSDTAQSAQSSPVYIICNHMEPVKSFGKSSIKFGESGDTAHRIPIIRVYTLLHGFAATSLRGVPRLVENRYSEKDLRSIDFLKKERQAYSAWFPRLTRKPAIDALPRQAGGACRCYATGQGLRPFQ